MKDIQTNAFSKYPAQSVDREGSIDDDSQSFSAHDTESQPGASVDPPCEENKPEIARRESMAVFLIRIIAALVLLLSTLAVALSVLFYLRTSERNTFEQRFKADSTKVLQSVGSTLFQSLEVIDSQASNIVSIANQTNQTWPFVTIADYAVRGSKILTLTRGTFITHYLFVTGDERKKWELYCLEKDEWMDEGIRIQEKNRNVTYFGPVFDEWTPKPFIYSFEYDSVPENRLYYPMWQSYPVNAKLTMYNWDFWQYQTPMTTRMWETRMVGISLAYHLPDPNDPADVAFQTESASVFSAFLPSGRVALEPMSEIYYVSTELLHQHHYTHRAKYRAHCRCPYFVQLLYTTHSPY
jgi:hypothetical protein